MHRYYKWNGIEQQLAKSLHLVNNDKGVIFSWATSFVLKYFVLEYTNNRNHVDELTPTESASQKCFPFICDKLSFHSRLDVNRLKS